MSYAPDVVHTTRPDSSETRCGATSGEVVPWAQVVDPDHPAMFSCGACWKDAAGGVEPMGGSLYRAEAHLDALPR